jgi:hypothetical protein
MGKVRVELPSGLCVLAGCGREIAVAVAAPVTQRRVLDAVEAAYPMLLGTMRDRHSGRRRPFIRFFACREDVSNAGPDQTLPAAVAEGWEIFYVVGAIAGG